MSLRAAALVLRRRGNLLNTEIASGYRPRNDICNVENPKI